MTIANPATPTNRFTKPFKRLVNFLNLRKNTKIPLADIGKADEIPVKLILEVGETSSGSFPRCRASPGNIRLSYRD